MIPLICDCFGSSSGRTAQPPATVPPESLGYLSAADMDVYDRYGSLMTQFLIALGSNLPVDDLDLVSTLRQALQKLDSISGVSVDRVSAWYRTPAWPAGSGPDFVNGAAALRSSRPPEEILQEMHGVEKSLGRQRKVRWGARTCDLDLLGAESLVLPDAPTVRRWIDAGPSRDRVPEGMLVPHPRIQERAFVLMPLADIAPDWVHPVLNLSVYKMLSAISEAERADICRLDVTSSIW